MTKLRDRISRAVAEVYDDSQKTGNIDGMGVDHDTVELDLMSEYEGLKGGHDIEMDAYNRSYMRYAMEPIGNERVGLSQTITPVIHEKIEWISSMIIKIITESNNAYDVNATGPENIFSAEVSKQLLNDSIGSGADNHVTIADVIRTAYIAGNSYIKCGWAAADKSNPVGHFTFESVPNERLRWDHDYGTFYKSPSVYDTTQESMSDIILAAEADGDWMVDELCDALSESGSESGEDNTKTESDRYNYSSSSSSANVNKPTRSRHMYTMVEAWTQYDINNDGVAEPVIAVFINGHLVRLVENNMPDGQHPYVYAQGKRNPNEALGWTMEKLLGHNQHNATMIDRMIVNNISSQDNGIMMYDERNVSPMAVAMHKRGIPRTMLPVADITRSIAPVAKDPLPYHVLQYKDNLLSAADGISGFTKSANLDIQMLKGTANNGNIVNNSGQIRIWEDTKRIIETTYKPLAMKCLAYSGEWLSSKDFSLRFGIDLSKREIKELLKSPRYKVSMSVSLPSDDAERLQQIMTWAQYFLPQAVPDAEGNMTPDAELISKAGSKLAFEAAKLMNLPNLERDLNGGNFVGTNGLSVSQEDVDSFRGSVYKGDGYSYEDERRIAEELAAGGLGAESEEAAPGGGEEEGYGGSGVDSFEGLLGAGGYVQGGADELSQGV